MDFLTTEPVVDFLDEQISCYEEDWKCVACGHALTLHTAGLVVYHRCLLEGCSCKKAVLTDSAAHKVKHGIMP